MTGLFCLLGIVGNVLSLIVLSRDRSRSAMFASFRALALSDTVLLVSALIQQVIPMICFITAPYSAFCRPQGYAQVYLWPIVCMAQMCSVWLTVLISTERYIAICYPFLAFRMCTVTKVRICCIGIAISVLLFNFPKFFEFYPSVDIHTTHSGENVTIVNVGFSELRSNKVYRYFYNTALYCILVYLAPLCILLVLNIKIILQMRQAKKQWNTLLCNQQIEHRITIIPLTVVAIFFICGTQSLIAFTLDAIFVIMSSWLDIYTAFANMLVTFNSAVNFIIFYVFGSKFRRTLCQLCRCYKSKTEDSLYQTSVSLRERNSVKRKNGSATPFLNSSLSESINCSGL